MPYAEVSVNSSFAQRQIFSYAIPQDLTVDVGQAVWVPFGDKVLQGIVLELSRYPSVTETREIASLIEPRPVLSTVQVDLADKNRLGRGPARQLNRGGSIVLFPEKR